MRPRHSIRRGRSCAVPFPGYPATGGSKTPPLRPVCHSRPPTCHSRPDRESRLFVGVNCIDPFSGLLQITQRAYAIRPYGQVAFPSVGDGFPIPSSDAQNTIFPETTPGGETPPLRPVCVCIRRGAPLCAPARAITDHLIFAGREGTGAFPYEPRELNLF